jgi:hypothetical protein
MRNMRWGSILVAGLLGEFVIPATHDLRIVRIKAVPQKPGYGGPRIRPHLAVSDRTIDIRALRGST